MPDWVLLVTDDSMRAAPIEQEIRMGGFSPRRAPDCSAARVLIAKAEPPAALIVDMLSGARGSVSELAQLVPGRPIVLLAPDEATAPRDLAERDVRVLPSEPAQGELSRCLDSL